MGRYSTDAKTTGQVLRIELNYLLKQGYIKKGYCISGTLSWTDNNKIGIYTCYKENEAYIELDYTITNHTTKENKSIKYRIELESIQSNLGKGEILYMVCPKSGKRCRVLYRCYGSDIWKSKESYQHRIYYESQLETKRMRPFKYMFLDKKIDELYRKSKKTHYQGKPTRIMKKISALHRKSELVDYRSLERLLCGIR